MFTILTNVPDEACTGACELRMEFFDTSAPRVVVTVLNFNGYRDTIDCIRSLQRCTYPSMEIIVVDNCSTDGSFENLKSEFPDLEITTTSENLGYTGGVNVSLRQAQKRNPDYILVLNNDTIVEPEFLKYLVTALEAKTTASAAAGTILAEHDRETIWYAGGRMIPLRGLAVHDRRGEKIDRSRLGEARTVSFINGCMVLFRATALGTVGLEDERFFMCLDDIEFSARMRNKGFDLLYVPRSIIYHKVLVERATAFKLYYSVRNRLLFISTSLSGVVRSIATVYFLSVIMLKICLWKVSNPMFYKAATFGLKDFFKGNFNRGRGITEFGY